MVYSISRSLPDPVSRPEPAHYHTYLTPLLHRRFARSCLTVLIVCYFDAFLMGNKSHFLWACFPLSWTGVRCMMLFLFAAFPVLILRISQLHLDTRAYESIFHCVRRLIGSFSTYITLFVYVMSCLTITALYLWSATTEAQLKIIVEGRSYERPRLNERFLYMIFLAVYTGVVQGADHVFKDKSRLVLSDMRILPHDAIKLNCFESFKRVLSLTFITTLSGPIVYLPLRSTIWENSLVLARTFYWLNRSTVLPSFPIGPGLFFRSFLVTLSALGLFGVSHLAFTSYFSYNLFPDGSYVSEKSSDQNGALLSGLRSTKSPLTRSLAFRELRYIAATRPDRRHQIYTDVGRHSKNAWEEILKECLKTLHEVDFKLMELTSSKHSSCFGPTLHCSLTKSPPPPPIPISQSDILVSTPSANGLQFVESLQSRSYLSPISSLKNRLNYSTSASPATCERSVLSNAKSRLLPYISSAYGKPFRQTIQLTASRILPNVHMQMDAVEAITSLVCASLAEDDYGVVYRHKSSILERFTYTLRALEMFCLQPQLHWTDTEAKNTETPIYMKEPHCLIGTLRSSIDKILEVFEPY